MAYAILTKKLLALEDDLYMQKALKKFLGGALETAVYSDRGNAPAFLQAGDISDSLTTGINKANKRR